MRVEHGHKLLLIAGMEHARGQKARQDADNPNASIIVHQSAAHGDRLINQHLLHGRGKRLHPHHTEKESLQDPME